MIEINHLVKKYGNHVAVDDLSLKVEKGKIYGFLGPNGAGKSTTMNIVTGYIGATSGEVKVNGYDIFRSPNKAKKCIGYLPEIPPLYMDMTVMEYMEFAAELKKLDKKGRRSMIEEAMETTRITDMSHRLIRNLSKGYRQRVGFAQAILGYPEVIILDEPTVGLDPQQIIEIRELIKELGKKHTVILSSHILTEIQAVCDHVFILAKGKLVASDSTDHLLSLMEKAQEIQMVVKGERAQVEKALEASESIDSIEWEEDTQGNVPEKMEEKAQEAETTEYPGEETSEKAEQGEGTTEFTKFVVRGAANRDIREELFQCLVSQQLIILEMHSIERSLEDVFLALTQKGEVTE